MSTRAIAAGVQQAWFGFVSNDKNILLGGTTVAPVAGADGNHAIQIVGIQTAPTGVTESDVVSVLGDDGVLGAFSFQSETPVSFILNTGENDLAKDALFQNSLVENFNGIDQGLVVPTTPQFPDGALLIQSRAKDTGNNGATAWTANVYLRVTVFPLDRETFAGREAASYRYQVVAQPATNKPTGTTLTTALNGYESSTIWKLKGENPFTFCRFTGNAALTTFTGLLKAPAGVNAQSIVAINGVQQATNTYSFNVANKTITFTSPPANNAAIVVVYTYTG